MSSFDNFSAWAKSAGVGDVRRWPWNSSRGIGLLCTVMALRMVSTQAFGNSLRHPLTDLRSIKDSYTL
ncbi:hypothetical protein [Serratia liquefaciens]|uniref:hypothetical protein n=1 Tax=Serratia liquefaciens TaxID=614 RepID=UPI00163D75F1|nr:hypothetical protein [Serratia liquefaciens]